MKTLRIIVVNLCRIVLSLTFILSGFVKAVDPLGTQYKIQDYLAALGLAHLPSIVTLGASILLFTIEFCIGIMLLLAVKKRLAVWSTIIFMSLMTMVTIWVAVADPVSDCGCFGDAIHLTNGQTLAKNILLLLMAIVIFVRGDDMIRFLSDANLSIVFSYSILFVIGTALWCLYYLPIFDFRPYHIGVNIHEAMQVPEDDPDTLPLINDFFIDTQDGQDITDEILTREGYTFLMLAPYLEQADDSNFGPIDQLYEYAQDHDYPFYCLTASNSRAISRWQDATGAEYPFYFTDATTLKTIVRSNPGMLLLHDGTIIQKWSHNELPPEEKLSAPLTELPIGQQAEVYPAKTILWLLLLYILPIVLLSVGDRLRYLFSKR